MITEYNAGNVAGRLQMSKSMNVIFYVFDFRQDLTCANDTYTHTHTHIHTHTNTHIYIIKAITNPESNKKLTLNEIIV